MSRAPETRTARLLTLPLLLSAFVFILVPVVGTILTSTFREVTFLPARYIGLDNYFRLLSDVHFRDALRFTLSFVVASVFFELLLAMVFALILNQTFPGRGPARVALLIPWAIPTAISARIWEWIYNFDFGVLNFLALRMGFSDSPVHWLGSPGGAFVALVWSDVWKTTPFAAVILLAGLAAIPEELHQQAMVDGAGILRRFLRITLPLLRPAIVVALLFRTIDAVRIFDLVYVLTGGGPGGETTSLSLYAYRYYLMGDFGYGSAVSVVVFLMAASLSTLYVRLGRFREVLR